MDFIGFFLPRQHLGTQLPSGSTTIQNAHELVFIAR
jgi:hypothetical protein